MPLKEIHPSNTGLVPILSRTAPLRLATWAATNSIVNAGNAGSFQEKCRLPYHRGVSATPTVSGSLVYYPTWDGHVVALNYKTCEVQWNVSVADVITQFAPLEDLQREVLLMGPVSRSSPQIDGNILYFTTTVHALLVAVERKSGALLDSIQINPHPLAIVTLSPTVYNGRIFVGTSSYEEVAVEIRGDYPYCSFIGNIAALDFDRTSGMFEVAWNVSMLPAGQGWSGSAVWGSQPSIDVSRSQVFFATGNLYRLPRAFEECQNQTADITVIAEGLMPSTCIPTDVYQEAILAFDIDTGLINWVRQLTPLDAWVVACGGYGGIPRNYTICPSSPGPDADFGMAPTFVPGSKSTPYGKDTIVIGQKNGELHALSAQTGKLFWSTLVTLTGANGGLTWGIAVDSRSVYFTGTNSAYQPWQLQSSNQTITNSGFGAASLVDGSLLWETAAPLDSVSWVPPSVVNDVVLVGRTGQNKTGAYENTRGGLIAINKATGKIIRDYELDANFHGGISIQDRFVMFGTGYADWNGTGSFHVWTV